MNWFVHIWWESSTLLLHFRAPWLQPWNGSHSRQSLTFNEVAEAMQTLAQKLNHSTSTAERQILLRDFRALLEKADQLVARELHS
jgi:hypothetical protein